MGDPVDTSALPLSMTRVHEGVVYASGMIGREADGAIPSSFERQAELAIEELGRQLEAAGASLETVLKTTVFVVDAADVPRMNAVYERHFSPPWPARSTIVTGLALAGLSFEIEAVAARR